MKILYTGAPKQGSEQLDPNLSLGHLVSNSVIPNDTLSNLFPATSTLSIQSKKRDTKMIALLNDEGESVLDLIFTFNIPADSICKYKIAFVAPTIKAGESCFEEIQNSGAVPYYATFQEIVNGDSLTIAELLDQAYLGIWITREFDYTSETLSNKTCADWKDQLETPVAVNEKEQFSFDLHYSLDSSTS
jgi:hypothetical protein